MNSVTDYDGAWKEALEHYLQPFLELAFPEVAAGIDWAQPVKYLNTELQEIVRDADLGKQRADVLVEVTRRTGQPEWILIHVEVQAHRDQDLPRRMYQYHHRLVDRYGRPVVSLAVLADEVPGWRPAEYEQSLFGCRLLFEYPACKLLDLQPRLPALIRARNPAAVVVAAHLATHRTKDNPRRRFLSKWRLARELYELEFNKAQVLELMRLLGWLLTLPQPLELDFRHQVLNLEQQKAMPFITSFERFAREEGLQQGEIRALREGILDNLDARFGTVPAAIQERLPRVADVSRLRHWHRLAVTVPDMATFLREFDDSASTGHGASPGTGQR